LLPVRSKDLLTLAMRARNSGPQECGISLYRFKLEQNYNIEFVLGSVRITGAFDKAKTDFSRIASKSKNCPCPSL
jgi:hypothetical protein